LFLALIQTTVVPMIAIGSIIPDLIIILVVLISLRHGQLLGTIFGSFSGIVFDIMSGGILGSAMFAKTIGGFIAGYFYNENKIDYNTSSMFFLIIVFISAAVNSFFYLLLTSSEIKLTASYLVLEQGVLPGIYTTFFAMVIMIYNQRQKSL
jgi:rod shape-determining protein MreD